jgi:N-acetylated-alpha-linked acidic dipeptidase
VKTQTVLPLVALLGLASMGFASADPIAADPAADHGIIGFTASHALSEHATESEFQSAVSATVIEKWHRIFTAEPHPAASPRNNELARIVADAWRRQGWEDVRIRRYDIMHSSPRHVALEMTAPRHFAASLREDPYPADADSRNPRISGAYFGYSRSGDVTAELVYAHSGNPADYDLLRKHGIDVRGKVVIVRYSNPYSYRGFKALTAEREGAAALLIYSDPAEDGFTRGRVFPDGPWGPESHIQRGAITYDFIVPGDPTTPGWASVPGARRIPNDAAQSLPKIVALPLSWRDAKPLLESMNGDEVPPEWRGALPITYRFSGGVRVHVSVDMDTSVKPYTVVEARIRGAELPEEWVLVGNHRDAWAFGGVDPVSGTASMLELTRALGSLKKSGHRPRRTIVVCSWDGEEYGLTGSTEWGEQFADELKSKLVAYLNVDEAVAGAATTAGDMGLSFRPAAVASLSPMLVQASRDVIAPNGKSLYEAWRATTQRDSASPVAPADSQLVETRIGSGSDHTVFLNHLGRPVVNLGFVGDYGVYHSGYDDFFWMSRIGDPGFLYHRTLTQMWGLTALRLANADVLPFDFGVNAAALQTFLGELSDAQQIDTSHLNLAGLSARIQAFGQEGILLEDSIGHALQRNGISPAAATTLNHQLMRVESNWLTPNGIPGRPWFQHLLYSSRYTYAHLEFPGLTEAVEASDWKRAGEQADLLEKAVSENESLLRSARSSLEGRAP